MFKHKCNIFEKKNNNFSWKSSQHYYCGGKDALHILPIDVDLISIRAYRAWMSGAGWMASGWSLVVRTSGESRVVVQVRYWPHKRRVVCREQAPAYLPCHLAPAAAAAAGCVLDKRPLGPSCPSTSSWLLLPYCADKLVPLSGSAEQATHLGSALQQL